jgi:glucosamine--fructose-6-phosphate aminotransferase (isomerizing)
LYVCRRESYKQYGQGQDYEVAGEILLRLEECIQEIPENRNYGEIFTVIILQLLAYKLSIARGINPDFPKNLAKVVTVE